MVSRGPTARAATGGRAPRRRETATSRRATQSFPPLCGARGAVLHPHFTVPKAEVWAAFACVRSSRRTPSGRLPPARRMGGTGPPPPLRALASGRGRGAAPPRRAEPATRRQASIQDYVCFPVREAIWCLRFSSPQHMALHHYVFARTHQTQRVFHKVFLQHSGRGFSV